MTDERIIAYLLEELPEEELEQFEDDCFADEDWPAQVNLAEEDLVDAYLRNELSQERRRRFEQTYLKTEARQERVMLAAALLRHIDKQQAEPKAVIATSSSTESTWRERLQAFWSGQTLALRAVAMIAIVSLIGGLLWLYLSRSPSSHSFVSLTLTISLKDNRSEGVQADKVKLPLPADILKISLKLPEKAPQATDYRVELDKDTGETKVLKIAERDAQSVVVDIPASQLTRGQYALKLFTVKEDGTEQRIAGKYFFMVE
jgi:hypothetical protein